MGGGSASTEMEQIIAGIQRSGVRLEWDDKAMRFTNDDAANKLVNPPYHSGWKI